MKALHCGQTVNAIWNDLTSKAAKIVGLTTQYKTNHSTFEGHMTIDSDKSLPIRYIKSSKQGD